MERVIETLNDRISTNKVTFLWTNVLRTLSFDILQRSSKLSTQNSILRDFISNADKAFILIIRVNMYTIPRDKTFAHTKKQTKLIGTDFRSNFEYFSVFRAILNTTTDSIYGVKLIKRTVDGFEWFKTFVKHKWIRPVVKWIHICPFIFGRYYELSCSIVSNIDLMLYCHHAWTDMSKIISILTYLAVEYIQ